MRGVIKKLWNESGLKNMGTKQRFIVWYFCVSLFMTLGINEEMNMLVVIFLILNICNAIRLVKSIDFSNIEE